jgi:hypothetical protein
MANICDSLQNSETPCSLKLPRARLGLPRAGRKELAGYGNEFVYLGLVHFYNALFASGFLGFEDDLSSFVQRSMKISQRVRWIISLFALCRYCPQTSSRQSIL